ncbi:hypothetical protein G7067_12530 [Leucobacter insecticola]|uniref:Uncharacterized protein n=1 Tax=Leucobacter insecticola TaxID=2714934 RepID=A0A6G8FL83_9MICO|nr:hypothetical protein [Leucobacter insecticola]QIM17043.1 hypothetical protein G7067_12530 [Leucobacter insecticola]
MSGFAASGAKLIDDAIDHLQDARQVNDDIPRELQESYQRVLQETGAMWFWVIDSYDVEEEAHRRGLQPERHMNLDAISQASAKIGKEIEELDELKATLLNVSSGRERQDVQQAAGFRF